VSVIIPTKKIFSPNSFEIFLSFLKIHPLLYIKTGLPLEPLKTEASIKNLFFPLKSRK